MPGARAFVISAAVSVGAAVAGAVAAARRAGRLAPAEAMRPPSPPLFRRREFVAPWLTRWLDQPTRIVLRQVMRRPLRAFLTSLGAATSVAVLVTALQWIDAINLLVEDFFHRQQHQDVTHRPRRGRARRRRRAPRCGCPACWQWNRTESSPRG